MTRHRYQWNFSKLKSSKNGIKARTSRGVTPVSGWWAKKWIDVVESCVDSLYLTKGRMYAKRGKVLSIKIESGLVTAFVQGTRATPYQIRLGFKTLSDSEKEIIVDKMREHAYFAAHLLVQKMPEEMEQVFSDAGAPFFPTKAAIRRYKCTCNIEATPCKHIVAVLLLLAEVIDDNPFVLLKLRGFNREELINRLTCETGQANSTVINCEGDIDDNDNESTIETLPEPARIEDFDIKHWYGESFNLTFEIEEKEKSTSALDIMNDFPFWRGKHSFRRTLIPYYERGFAMAYEILHGEKKAMLGRPKKLI